MSLIDMGIFEEKKVFQIGVDFARIFNKPDKEMDRKDLMDEINKLILNHNTCTLATGSGDFVRNTPIEYT